MNAEELWLAIGEAEEGFVAEAKSFPKKRAGSLHILLAAAIILALSVSAMAVMKYRAEIKNIWNGERIPESTASEIESGTIPIDAEESAEEYTAAITEALSDGRNLYVVWQLERNGEPFPEGTNLDINLDFGTLTVNTDMGYIGGRIETENPNILSGYVVTDWNEAMQNSAAALTIGNIEAPYTSKEGEYAPDWASLFAECEYVDFPDISYIRGSDWPREYFPQYGRLEYKIEDSACNIIDFACVEEGWLYLTVKNPEPVQTPNGSKWVYALVDGETGKEIPCEYRLAAREAGEPPIYYYVLAYKAEEDDIKNFVLQKQGAVLYKPLTEQGFRLGFSAEAVLEDTVLPCAVSGAEINCSPLSLSISGVEFYEEPDVEITGGDGKTIGLLTYDPKNILFETPIDPLSIASIKINGIEYLAG